MNEKRLTLETYIDYIITDLLENVRLYKLTKREKYYLNFRANIEALYLRYLNKLKDVKTELFNAVRKRDFETVFEILHEKGIITTIEKFKSDIG